MENKAVFRTPLRKLRALIAVVCWVFSGFSFLTFFLYSPHGIPSFVTGLVFVAGGLAVLFLERVCELDGRARSVSSAWFFMNQRMGGGNTVMLEGADAVRLALVEGMTFPWDRSVIRAKKAFPVWIMRGDKALTHVIGWKQPDDLRSDRGGWNYRIWNSAWFPEYARYVASVCAKVLNLPLVDQKAGQTIPADGIPVEWLYPNKVRFHLMWELDR